MRVSRLKRRAAVPVAGVNGICRELDAGAKNSGHCSDPRDAAPSN
jgi:hypothetical protein